MTKKLNQKQTDILVAGTASAPPSYCDQLLDYAIKYLSILVGPLDEDDVKQAVIIARQKILHDKGIPVNMYDLQHGLYRSLREENHPTHELIEVPTHRIPREDDSGRPAKTIEHEPTPAEPAPAPVNPLPTKLAPEPTDNDAEMSRVAHIGGFLAHIGRYG